MALSLRQYGRPGAEVDRGVYLHPQRTLREVGAPPTFFLPS